MILSKTKFTEILKQKMFKSLKEINSNQNLNLIDDLNSLKNIEGLSFKREVLDNVSDLVDDAQLEMMLPFYNELEIVTGNIIKEHFGSNVIFDLDTKNQKMFEAKIEGHSLYCFLDGFLNNNDTDSIFETKATTSNKFSLNSFPVTFKNANKTSKDSFFKEVNGIYYPLEELEYNLENSNYYNIEKKLFDISDKRGKYIYDLAFQRFVYEKSAAKKSNNSKFYLVVLNHEYKYDGKKDNNGNNIYSKDLLKFYDLTSITKKMIKLIEEDFILVTNNLESNDLSNNLIDTNKLLEENSILSFLDNHHGFSDKNGNKYSTIDLIKNFNYYKMIDVDDKFLNRKNNLIQKYSVLNNEPYYNKEKIKAAINTLKYPIYHLDFESFNAPIPRFKGESPYAQSLFQFSVHIEKEQGVCDKDLDNYSYLMKDHNDNRKELVKELLKVIKDDGGSIMVYNVAFEKTRLKELAILFPEYKTSLEKLISRLFDLQHIVKTNKNFYLNLGFTEEIASEINFYHPKLNGSYSIKKVLPIFSNLSYDNLVVSNGLEAMQTYVKFPTLSEKEFLFEYNELIRYCKQDTYAMYEILSKLRKI